MVERQFTSDWFSNAIELWTTLALPLLPKENVQCLEIGSYEGRSACWILDNIVNKFPNSHLDCVDLWPGLHEQEAAFDRNLAGETRVTKHKGFSIEFLYRACREQAKYDFIYVDADHHAEFAFTDATLAWHCLKKKGVMIIDDYLYTGDENRGLPSTKTGIDAFLHLYPDEIRLLAMEYQVYLQKR
jgi:predicted O-methyltransferase YrrM